MEQLDAAGVEYLINPLGRKLAEEELAEMITDYDVLIAGTEDITDFVMAKAKKLKLISRVGIGLDNVDLLAEKNYSILWKRKRNIGTSAHPLYRSLVNRLDMLKGVVLIDSEISAVKVIERSDIVILIPFTSTALTARSLGKTSAYYDPTGMIAKNDVAGHGIPLLSNYKELFHWVSEVCDEKKLTETIDHKQDIKKWLLFFLIKGEA